MIRLVADIGATNSRWLVEQAGQTRRLDRPGYNATTDDRAIWPDILRSLELDAAQPVEAFLYGAGFNPLQVPQIEAGFISVFPHAAAIEIDRDLMGACHGMAHTEEAIIAILGTGSNSAHYKDNGILKNMRSGGFLLGDEGSAAQIGKAVIQNLMRDQMPVRLATLFSESYPEPIGDIIRRVYEPGGIAYLGQFAKFAHAHLGDPWMENLVTQCLSEFVSVLASYKSPHLPHYFSGSIAVHFQDILTGLCHQSGIGNLTIIPDYLDGLARYHAQTAAKVAK